MVYKFLLLSDEVDNFEREIEIDSSASFLDFHKIITRSLNYDNGQFTSFFTCNEDWEKEQEITLIEMDTSSEYDNLIMEDTVIEDYVSDEGQRLIYVFDYMAERVLFIELKEIIPNKTLKEPVCVSASGEPPVQLLDFNDMEIPKAGVDTADFYESDEELDLDDIDEEGFSDVNFDDIDDRNLY